MRSFYRVVDSNDFQRMCIHQNGIGKLKQRLRRQSIVSTETPQLVRQLQDMVLELKSDLRLAVGRDSPQPPEVRAPDCYGPMAVEGTIRACTQQPEWKARAPDTASGDRCLELELRIAKALKQVQRLDEASAEGVAEIAGSAARAEFSEYLTVVGRGVGAPIHDGLREATTGLVYIAAPSCSQFEIFHLSSRMLLFWHWHTTLKE